MMVEEDGLDLFTWFGTTSPCWRLSIDSNALELATVRGPANVSVPLDASQAAQIRALTGVTSHLALDIKIFGYPYRLHLVGKKINIREWAGTASDYTDTSSVARDLVHGLAFAEQVVSEVNSLVVILDGRGIIQRFNRMCEEVTGMREEDVIGKSAYVLFMSDDEGAASRSNINGFFASGQPYQVERYINTVTGPRLFLFRNKFVQSGSGVDERFLICSGTDITEERKAQQLLVKQATTDELTGLLNRKAIQEEIENAIAAEKEAGDNVGEEHLGILFLDLDNFKKVNDHYGHVVGDRLIREVSAKIKSCLAPGDTLARLGGDEFVVVIRKSTIALLTKTAETILSSLQQPFDFGLIKLYTGCSIGIALYPEHGDRLESLIRSADTAMYVAKDDGKHTYRVFTPEMNRKVAEYVWLDTNLRKALEERQLELYYQPKVSLRSGEVDSVEALVRWNSPERGVVSPLDFIPYAEESGLIGPLGRWVMHAAATQASNWQMQGIDLRISINVSARQLRDTDIVKHFTEVLAETHSRSCMLDVELTESCFIEDEAAALVLIGQFRKMGVRVHLDDFGTGYSSLSQLSRIPLDAIKLDRSFIKGIDVNSKPQALVRAMVAIAHELRLSVVAEGVETEAEADFLRGLGVDLVQGFLYARPMPARAFEAWLAEKRKLRLIA
ncbi:cyclic di-GMP phosphodiesterase [Caballeronia sp. DA-9]|uniref:cyclic di-GMP phosphodiesterase n=1 Tax=Caballeronia sp. DA-9 TaxID=3436237 RepID=UPI003F6699E5